MPERTRAVRLKEAPLIVFYGQAPLSVVRVLRPLDRGRRRIQQPATRASTRVDRVPAEAEGPNGSCHYSSFPAGRA